MPQPILKFDIPLDADYKALEDPIICKADNLLLKVPSNFVK